MSNRSPILHREGLPAVHDVGAQADEAMAGEADADIVAADEARRRLRHQGVVPIEPDDRIRARLLPLECVVTLRREVALERRMGSREPRGGLDGDLYVTTLRLVLLGRIHVEYALADIQEIDVGIGVVRLVVDGSHGVVIRVRDPRVLRVEICAAREAGRATLP